MGIVDEGIQAVLAGVSMMLVQIPVEDLEAYVKKIDAQHSQFEAVGWVTDPTAYQRAISGDPEYKSLVIQLETAKHLLKARQEMEKLKLLGKGQDNDL